MRQTLVLHVIWRLHLICLLLMIGRKKRDGNWQRHRSFDSDICTSEKLFIHGIGIWTEASQPTEFHHLQLFFQKQLTGRDLYAACVRRMNLVNVDVSTDVTVRSVNKRLMSILVSFCFVIVGGSNKRYSSNSDSGESVVAWRLREKQSNLRLGALLSDCREDRHVQSPQRRVVGS